MQDKLTPKSLLGLFTDHPHESGETFMEHLWFTVKMSSRIILCGICLMVHGILPFTFRRTTSRQIEAIYGILKKRIPKAKEPDAEVNIGAGI